MPPPVPAEEIGHVEAVLLSHALDQHNLDNAGRAVPPPRGRVPTHRAWVLALWDTVEISRAAGEILHVTRMPAVHAKDPAIRNAGGETSGFLLEWDAQENGAFHISGDPVWIRRNRGDPTRPPSATVVQR